MHQGGEGVQLFMTRCDRGGREGCKICDIKLMCIVKTVSFRITCSQLIKNDTIDGGEGGGGHSNVKTS